MSPQSVRNEVLALVEAAINNPNLRRHMVATEAVMSALALRLGTDQDTWGLAGLAHDLDAEQTSDDFTRHGAQAAEQLSQAGLPEDVTHAIAAHNPATGVLAEAPLDIALIACDQVTGLITAATLVRPDKSLAGVKVKSLRKRMRESAFARGVDRRSIERCEEIDITLDEFLDLALQAMQGRAAERRDMGQGSDQASPHELFETGCRFLRERHPGQAALYLERARACEPEKSSIHEALGQAYHALGEYEKAVTAFTAVVRLYPTNDYAQFARSRALLAIGRSVEALAAARLAAAMVPDNKDYRRAVRDCLRAVEE
jgi:putative nucleotidyltransferase with HDIG domain